MPTLQRNLPCILFSVTHLLQPRPSWYLLHVDRLSVPVFSCVWRRWFGSVHSRAGFTHGTVFCPDSKGHALLRGRHMRALDHGALCLRKLPGHQAPSSTGGSCCYRIFLRLVQDASSPWVSHPIISSSRKDLAQPRLLALWGACKPAVLCCAY